MKIMIVTDAWTPQLNGVVRTYEGLRPALERLGHTVRIAGPADFPWRMPLPGYREIELALFPYRRLAAMIDEFAPDTIHVGTEAALGLAARRYCLARKIPFTTCYHTHFPDYAAKRVPSFLAQTVRTAGTNYLRRFHKPSAALMTAAASLERELKEKGFSAPLHRVTRGVDFGLFTPDGPRIFENLPRPVALYVGRIAVEKNLEDFLRMDWRGSKVVVGDGPALDALRGKYPDAHFAGRREGADLAAHYRSADLFVFPSRTDTFGMVLAEALACGLPLAGYDVTGPRDIVTAPFLGAVHESDLAAAAAAALAAGGTAQERRDHAMIHYSWNAAARQFMEGVGLAGPVRD